MKSPRTRTSFFFSATAVYIIFLSMSQSKLHYYIEFLFSYRDTSYVLGEGIVCISAMKLLSSSKVIWKNRRGPEIKYSLAVLECLLCSFSGVRTVNHTALHSKTSVTCLEGTWCLNEVKLLSCNTGKTWQQEVVDSLYLKVSRVVEEQVRTNIKGNTVLKKHVQTCSFHWLLLFHMWSMVI